MSVKADAGLETAKFSRRIWITWAAVLAALVVGGLSYRYVAGTLMRLTAKRVILPVPLAEMPKGFGDWKGEDSELPPEVIRIADNDDYVNRVFVKSTGEAADLYVAYSGRPRTMVGHMPQVCYVNSGWIHDFTKKMELELEDDAKLPCILHKFHQPPPKSGEVYVLNYYILNGVTTNDEESFAGVAWRMPNINGNPAWYVTQVQISSRSQAAVMDLATATVGKILEYLPDREGKVAAAK